MLNAEHYPDPTASAAISYTPRNPKNGPKRKITYLSDPVYKTEKKPPLQPVKVSNEKAVPISEMTMEDLKPFLWGCHKCSGNPLVCVDCLGGCAYGTRAAELLDQMTKGVSAQELGREKGAQTMQRKAMLEYQAAIDSGDPIKFIMDTFKDTRTEKQKLYQATAKLKRWEKSYGSLIKKHEPEKTVEVHVSEELPHLMQMPCLSKKVAAERAAKEQEEKKSAEIAQVFTSKIESLRSVVADIQKQIDDLISNKDSIEKQIAQIEETAGLLDIAI